MLFYVLQCEVAHCAVELYLNDIPVVLRGEEFGKEYGAPVNHLLVDGVNTIGMVINPGTTPGTSIAGEGGERGPLALPEEARITVSLATYPRGAVVGGPDEEVIFSTSWSVAAGQTAVYPQVHCVSHDLGELFGRWSWQDGERIELDEATRAEINTFVTDFHAALEQPDVEYFISASQTRIDELDRAYSSRPGEREKEIEYMLKSNSAMSWWGIEPLLPEEYDFRLCAEDRLVQIISAQWQPVIAEKPDLEGAVNRFHMMLARLDGEWAIVR